MAKLKVKQIEDLLLTDDNTPGAKRTIQIGANSIIPLTSVNVSGVDGGYISDASFSGNIVTLTKTALPEITVTAGTGISVTSSATTEDGNDVTYTVAADFTVDTIKYGSDAGDKAGKTYIRIMDGTTVISETDLSNAIEALDATVRGTSDGQVSAIPTELTVEGHTGAYVAVEVVEEDGKITGVNVKENIDDTIKNAIEALDGTATIATVTNDGVVTLKAGIVQTDGKVSQGEGSDIVLKKVAFTGDAADVDVATGIEGLTASNVQAALAELQGDIDAINGQTITAKENQAVEVTTAENGNTTIGLELAEGEKVLSQTAAGLKTTLTVDTKKYPTENTAEGYVADKAGKTYIQIKGIGGEVISETDAAAFVKDGMLNTATVVKGIWTGESFTESTEGQNKAIKLVWNTDAGKEAMYINAETLVDSYTAGNGWIVIDQNANTISHKTQGALGAFTAEETKTFGTKTDDGHFSFPKVTVDAAGHVTAMEELSISVATTVYVPKREDFTVGDTLSDTVTLTSTPDLASGVDVYLNGQLLAAAVCTVDATAKTVTIAPYSTDETDETDETIDLEADDMIMVRYFVKETVAPVAPQA